MKNIGSILKTLTTRHKTNDPFQIAKEKGIIVLFEELGNTLGYYNAHKRIQLIHINNKLSELEQRFVCAHELGHAVLHPNANTPFLRKNTFFSVDKIEVEANYFAVHLLLSNEDLKNYETKFQVLQKYGIPYEMERFI
ncbi:ImmA/IrrE family metallo-endopeptidase [Bacillus smithii]|uniref:ImmA/IrrE family metallo-endopeptidase n=1 Tax=Bacillus smithii TaxID=1479 RepID=UPI003D213A9B